MRKRLGPNTATMRMNWGHIWAGEHDGRASSSTRAR